MIKKVLIDKANRLYQFPPDIFSFIRGNEKPSLIKKTELIDLGRFNWNIEFDSKTEISPDKLSNCSPARLNRLKESIADWFYDQHKIRLNPAKEIYIGRRISNILLHTALAFIDNSDIVFVPELGLPIYKKVTTTAGGEPVSYSLSNKNDWQPDFERLSTRLGRVARLLFLNTPHNPTGRMLNNKDIENLIWVAARENIAVINDAAYHSISNRPHSSLIGTKDGKKIGLEIYSFSYQFGLPQLPYGFAVGNKDLIEGLTQTSSLSPQSIPEYYIDLALEAIRHYPSEILSNLKKDYKKTSVEAARFLELLSLEDNSSDTIPFLWAKIFKRKSAASFAAQLYRKYRILCAPGTVFGDSGEGYIRFSLTASPDAYKNAYDRVKKKLRLLKSDKPE